MWDVCRRVCNVYRHDIGAGTTTRIPTTLRGRYQYRPSVTADGTVYFVHSGAGVRPERPSRAATPRRAAGGGASLPPGRDIFSKTQAVPDATSGTDVYYSQARCTNPRNARDIYEVVVP